MPDTIKCGQGGAEFSMIATKFKDHVANRAI